MLDLPGLHNGNFLQHLLHKCDRIINHVSFKDIEIVREEFSFSRKDIVGFNASENLPVAHDGIGEVAEIIGIRSGGVLLLITSSRVTATPCWAIIYYFCLYVANCPL